MVTTPIKHQLRFKIDPHLLQFIQTLESQSFSFSDRSTKLISSLKQSLTQLEIQHLRDKAIAQGVWDFYPTPQAVTDKMLSLVNFKSGNRILEPSAGSGDLCLALQSKGISHIDCFELHPLLQKVLLLQGFNLIGDDFLAATPQPLYDFVIANPPFSQGGVTRHTMHAFEFLRPGGRLISLAHHYTLKPSHSDKAFFRWLKSHNARFFNCGRAFSHSDRPTAVPLQIISISKL